jgi:hypothetical protein
MESTTKCIDLKHRPENLSERLIELGFESKGNDRWEKEYITVIEHNRELDGKKFYTLRLNASGIYENKIKEMHKIHELLDKEYGHLKINAYST